MPTLWHVFYIPGVLLLGISFGYRLGARAMRLEYERQAKARKR